MCVDMVQPNKVIKRVGHVIPTVEELSNDLNEARAFSKHDLDNGFHQLELNDNSQDITTFSTHARRWHYHRLNFGTSSASEIFYEELRKKLDGIQRLRNIHDYKFIVGKVENDH